MKTGVRGEVASESAPSRCNGSGERISWAATISFASLLCPLVLASVPMISVMPAYYVEGIGFSLTTVGLVNFVGRIADILADAAIGFLCDATTSRFGRRRIWIFLASPAFLLSLWCLFSPPRRITVPAYFTVLTVFYVSWTSVFIPYQAQGAELTRDPRWRNRLYLAQGAILAGSMVVSTGWPQLLLGGSLAGVRSRVIAFARSHRGGGLFAWLQTAGPDTAAQYGGFLKITAASVTMMMFVTLALYLALIADRSSGTTPPRPRDSLRLVCRNRPFHRLLVGHFFIQAATCWYSGLMPFFLADILRRPDLLLPLLTLNPVAGILATPVWACIIHRLGRAPAYSIAGAVIAIGLLLLWLTPTSGPWLLIVAFFVLGIPAVTIVMLPFALAADSADFMSWRYRTDSTAVHMSMASLTSKAGVATGAIAMILAGTLGFDPGRSPPTASGIMALHSLSTLAPAAMALLGAAIVLTFPITKHRHKTLVERLRRRATSASHKGDSHKGDSHNGDSHNGDSQMCAGRMPPGVRSFAPSENPQVLPR